VFFINRFAMHTKEELMAIKCIRDEIGAKPHTAKLTDYYNNEN
jgi:hypothetical protein